VIQPDRLGKHGKGEKMSWQAAAWLTLLSVSGTAAPDTNDKNPPAGTVADYTKADLKELGVVPVKAEKDPRTGFVVGGKNPTALVAKLTEIAGRPVADLERDMRPGRLSSAGFLGKDERLTDVLAEDNRIVVDQRKLSHQELARHLHILGALAVKLALKGPKEFSYHGGKYKVEAKRFRASVDSPFQDGTKTNTEVTITNLDNGKSVRYSLLVPHLIERYGFYEGRGTRFRVEPGAILDVLDFLPKGEGK
jgi:hypothetical protein